MSRREEPDATQVQDILPPVVMIVDPEEGSAISANSVTIHYRVQSPGGEPVTGVHFFVDGRPVSEAKGLVLVSAQDTQGKVITVPSADCTLSIVADNAHGSSDSSSVHVVWKGAAGDAFVIRPKLYVLAVGVSRYDKPEYRLSFAAKDVQDFVSALQTQKGRIYRDIEVRALTDESATKDNILDGLDWIQKQTTSKDVAMVFLSGHGVNDSTGLYYYLPVGADLERLKRTGVPFADIKSTVSNLAGKALFFIDTCHSGDVMGGRKGFVDTTAVVNELASAENGAVVFTASTGSQYSLEDPAWGNGAFTKALVEGLNGKAALGGGDRITVNMLDLYISERVKALTGGWQTPTSIRPQSVPDFPVAMR